MSKQQQVFAEPYVTQSAYVEVTITRWKRTYPIFHYMGKYADEILPEDTQLMHNLTLNSLRDQLADRLYTRTTNDGPRGAGFIALSENNTAPSASDTTMSGETALSGLTRQDATTKSHSGGTNTTTVSHQFTAGAAGTIMKAGLNTASSSGNFYHVTVFASNAVLAINDLLTVTFTITHA